MRAVHDRGLSDIHGALPRLCEISPTVDTGRPRLTARRRFRQLVSACWALQSRDSSLRIVLILHRRPSRPKDTRPSSREHSLRHSTFPGFGRGDPHQRQHRWRRVDDAHLGRDDVVLMHSHAGHDPGDPHDGLDVHIVSIGLAAMVRGNDHSGTIGEPSRLMVVSRRPICRSTSRTAFMLHGAPAVGPSALQVGRWMKYRRAQLRVAEMSRRHSSQPHRSARS